jgi:hypothetical protein
MVLLLVWPRHPVPGSFPFGGFSFRQQRCNALVLCNDRRIELAPFEIEANPSFVRNAVTNETKQFLAGIVVWKISDLSGEHFPGIVTQRQRLALSHVRAQFPKLQFRTDASGGPVH